MLACSSSLACLWVWPCCTIAHRTRAPVFLLHLITQVVSYFSIELLTPSPHARTPNNARNLHAASPPRVYGVSETGATYDGIVAGLGVGEGKTARRQHIYTTLRSARNSVTKPCYARMTHGTGTIAFALSSTRNADEIFPRTLAHLQKCLNPHRYFHPSLFFFVSGSTLWLHQRHAIPWHYSGLRCNSRLVPPCAYPNPFPFTKKQNGCSKSFIHFLL